MRLINVLVIRPAWVYNPLIRRGWQHDGRNAHNPADTPPMPQKIPNLPPARA